MQDLKQAIAETTDAPADRQRLIYSGKVLKVRPSSWVSTPAATFTSIRFPPSFTLHRSSQNEEPLSNYKIQSGHTVHMVKSAARSGGNPSTSGPTPSQALPQMQAGQNPHDPLTQLNSHLGFGAMAGFNPFADSGVNTNDPNMVRFRRLREGSRCF